MKRLVMALSLAACALMLGSFTQATAAETVHLSKKQVKELIANPKTPDDHMKLSAYFNQQADELEADAKHHEELAEIYRSRPAVLGSKSSVPIAGNAAHCGNIAKLDREAAKEDRELAASHESMAKAAEK